MSQLSKEEFRELLAIARRAIHESVLYEREWLPPESDGALSESRGAFVTLKRRGRLRGCVGQVGSAESLARTVARCAVGAAREDARFLPVTREEVSELEIEISALTAPIPLAPDQIEIGRHGLLIQQGRAHGLLLPQVAIEHGFNASRFLEETCAKAGLPRLAWKTPTTQIFGFTAEIFSEAKLTGARSGEF